MMNFLRRGRRAPFGLVIPSDEQNLDRPSKWIAIPEIGDVSVVAIDGTTVVIPAGCISPGAPFHIAIKRINKAGTDQGIAALGVLVGYDMKRRNGDDGHDRG